MKRLSKKKARRIVNGLERLRAENENQRRDEARRKTACSIESGRETPKTGRKGERTAFGMLS